MVRNKVGNDFVRTISRAVIYHDDLEIWIFRIEYGRNRRFDADRFIPCRDQD